MTQLIITMRAEFARKFARNKSLFDISALLDRLDTARLVGAPGYSMRVILDEDEVPVLAKALGPNFVIEQDYALDTFGEQRRAGRQRSSSAAAEIRRR